MRSVYRLPASRASLKQGAAIIPATIQDCNESMETLISMQHLSCTVFEMEAELITGL